MDHTFGAHSSHGNDGGIDSSSAHHGHGSTHGAHDMMSDASYINGSQMSTSLLDANPSPAATAGNTHGMDGMHMMSFHFGTKETLLFDFWQVDGVSGLILSCVIIFILAFCYEAIKMTRAMLAYKERRSRYTAVRTSNGVPTQPNRPQVEDVETRPGIWSRTHLQQTALYVVQLTLAYFLMLLFMCCNVWICLAVVLGAGMGYLVCGRTNDAVLSSDHCTA